MERVHRIFTNRNPALKSFLDRYGIEHKYEESIVGETVFLLIAESHPHWPLLEQHLAGNRDLVHTVELDLSKENIRGADYCELGSTGHFGFPQPEDKFEYQNVTYDAGSGCRTCGIGLVQVAPFRFRKPPTQRQSHLLQLNWVFDEFFVSERARADLEVSGLTGFHFEPVVLHKTGQPLSDWHHMRVDDQVPGTVDTSTFIRELCAVCGKSKFHHPTDQLISVRLGRRDFRDVVKTAEWFGSGGSAWRSTLVSRDFVAFVLNRRWRGVDLTPIQIAEAPIAPL